MKKLVFFFSLFVVCFAQSQNINDAYKFHDTSDVIVLPYADVINNNEGEYQIFID